MKSNTLLMALEEARQTLRENLDEHPAPHPPAAAPKPALVPPVSRKRIEPQLTILRPVAALFAWLIGT